MFRLQLAFKFNTWMMMMISQIGCCFNRPKASHTPSVTHWTHKCTRFLQITYLLFTCKIIAINVEHNSQDHKVTHTQDKGFCDKTYLVLHLEHAPTINFQPTDLGLLNNWTDDCSTPGHLLSMETVLWTISLTLSLLVLSLIRRNDSLLHKRAGGSVGWRYSTVITHGIRYSCHGTTGIPTTYPTHALKIFIKQYCDK